MTTIAYSRGVLAGDTRIVNGDASDISPGHVRKVFKLPNGCLIGFAGTVSRAQEIMRDLKRNPDKLDIVASGDDEIDILLVYPDGVVRDFDSNSGWSEIEAKYFAIGSGALEARVAMECGKTAAQAVRIAMKFDGGTGGKVQTVKLGRLPKGKTSR